MKNDSTPSGSDDEQVKMSPWLIALGVVALVVGLASGFLMSQATLFK